MKQVIQELDQIVQEYSKKIRSIPENEFSAKPFPQKWSKKEVIGHLIDSAQNNLRRFVVGQYEPFPPKITYNQNFWVKANGYQNMSQKDVIELWRLINLRIAAVLENMNPERYSKQADTGKDTVELHTLEWLAADYNRHLKHHINQIIPGSFDVIYQ